MKFYVTKLFMSVFLLASTAVVKAQSADAFLACEQYSDRVERVICLEEALESVTAESDVERNPVAQEQTDSVEDFGRRETSRETTAGQGREQAEEKSGFRLPVIGNIFRRDRNNEEPEGTDNDQLDRGGNEDRMENFGRGRSSRVVRNEDGREELFATITEATEARPNMWLFRLDNDQVWRQTHPRRYNLREGDEVRIYPTQWGENFRLETSRLNGYIQVLRVE